MSIIGKSIEDQILIDTIYKFFNASLKGIERDGPDTNKGVRVLQGNPLSFLLANIYLNEFDQFVISLKKKVNKGKTLSKNVKKWDEAIKGMANKLIKVKIKKIKSNLKREICRKQIRETKKIGIRQKFKTNEKQFCHLYHKIYYVRYADDYLIAIKGPKKLAKEILKRTESFLKFNLYFELKSGKLIHGKDNKTNFLEFDIKIPSKKDKTVVETKKILSFKKIKNRISARKRALETRFENTILKVYESQKLKTIKALMTEKKEKKLMNKITKMLAIKDVKEIMKNIKLNGNKWYNNQEPFDKWIQREYIHLRSSWIKETELKKLGYEKVIKSYENFLKTLNDAISTRNISRFKKEEAKCIQSKPKFFQKKNRPYVC